MMAILSLILSGTFTVLALIHFIWAFGIKWGLYFALPTNDKGETMFHPKKKDCIIVGLGLSIFALFYLIQSTIIIIVVSYWIFVIGGWIIPSIFIIRAIGNFKYIGFFKKIRNTNYGHFDSLYYTPLCLTIGVIGIIIQLK